MRVGAVQMAARVADTEYNLGRAETCVQGYAGYGFSLSTEVREV